MKFFNFFKKRKPFFVEFEKLKEENLRLLEEIRYLKKLVNDIELHYTNKLRK
jgi:hypothetical protein